STPSRGAPTGPGGCPSGSASSPPSSSPSAPSSPSTPPAPTGPAACGGRGGTWGERRPRPCPARTFSANVRTPRAPPLTRPLLPLRFVLILLLVLAVASALLMTQDPNREHVTLVLPYVGYRLTGPLM